jgi:hypothetical protein
VLPLSVRERNRDHRLAHGRVHPAFLWGGTLLMLSLPGRFALSQTEAWLSVARWLTK